MTIKIKNTSSFSFRKYYFFNIWVEKSIFFKKAYLNLNRSNSLHLVPTIKNKTKQILKHSANDLKVRVTPWPEEDSAFGTTKNINGENVHVA